LGERESVACPSWIFHLRGGKIASMSVVVTRTAVLVLLMGRPK
jgi:hypothetical protein